MKKIALALLFCGASAFATPVTYSAAAVFAGPDLVPGNKLSNGTATLTYTPVPPTGVNAPTNISLGDVISAGGTGTFTNDKITLTITQIVPAPGGMGTTSATINGTITSTSNGIDLVFVPSTFTIKGNPDVAYILQNDYFLPAPDTNGGVTTLQADIIATPEPASLGLLGGSLLGLGMLVRRRTAKK